jgi:transcriptional antiterminator Rof (Rho-off)
MLHRLSVLAVAAVMALVATVGAAAHEVTYKGTVVTADAKTVKVSVINAKTKKPEEMVFKHDGETKILRSDKVVSFAQARVTKGEKISVTINHDDLPEFALVIRLDEKK